MSGARAATPAISGVVVHWHDEAALAALAATWTVAAAAAGPERCELIVVDNGSAGFSGDLAARVIRPPGGTNAGFAGGANLGVAAARGEIVLLLNPDACPAPDALAALLDGFARHPEAAGLAPALAGGDGAGQWRWQLKPLPSPGRLVAEGLFLPAARGPREEPAAGTPVEQPAAAALALRRAAWERVGGMDAGFYPAWFEDVDLARRLRGAGERLLYWPAARFRHGLGSTVPRLGFGPFLWIYTRNLARYLRVGHGGAWAGTARAAIALGAVLRLLALPLRTPRRATGRGDAAAGLATAALGAASNWRLPRALAARWAPPAAGQKRRSAAVDTSGGEAPR